MANIDLGNLTRYDGKIKEYTEDKYLSKNTANWQMTEKAGAVTCYPVPDTDLEPIVDFSFKEVPPANGEKSPSNPSTIEGVSSIFVGRCGKNLLRYPYYEGAANKGFFFTPYDNGTVQISSFGTGNAYYSVCDVSTEDALNYPKMRLVKGQSYTASLKLVSGTLTSGAVNLQIAKPSSGFNTLSPITTIGTDGQIQWSNANSAEYMKARIQVIGSTVLNNLVVAPQLEKGNISTSFEPYTGNDYIYSLDNTYYGGKVNLATGEMTVTYNISRVGDYSNTVEFNNEYNCWRVYITPKADYTILPICTHSTFKQGPDFLNATDSTFRWAAGGLGQWFMFKSPVTTAEEFLAVYENAYIVFKLLNPYMVQLNPTQIKSLTALDKNTPRLNTLYTDADSIQVGYQKHPARTSYELENAILALGGGE